MKPDDFSGCLRLDGDVVSDVEFDWYGSDELIDGWFELGLRGGCEVCFCEPLNG